jgi:hypothetical protein
LTLAPDTNFAAGDVIVLTPGEVISPAFHLYEHEFAQLGTNQFQGTLETADGQTIQVKLENRHGRGLELVLEHHLVGPILGGELIGTIFPSSHHHSHPGKCDFVAERPGSGLLGRIAKPNGPGTIMPNGSFTYETARRFVIISVTVAPSLQPGMLDIFATHVVFPKAGLYSGTVTLFTNLGGGAFGGVISGPLAPLSFHVCAPDE